MSDLNKNNNNIENLISLDIVSIRNKKSPRSEFLSKLLLQDQDSASVATYKEKQ